MRFYDYADHYAAAKKLGLDARLGVHNREDMYNVLIPNADQDPIGFRHIVFDREWYRLGKPYYDVYPCVMPMLMKLNLNFPGEVISPPCGIKHLLLRLPENQDILRKDDLRVRVLFISFQMVAREVGSMTRELGLAVGIDIGEAVGGLPVYTIRVFPLDERPIEKTLFSLIKHRTTYEGIQVPEDLLTDSIRLALTVCLIDNNSEFLEQQVLSKDESKFALANEEKRQLLLAKAKRRGKWGYSLGKNIEMIPHYRRPHPCIVWTGRGRAIPKIVLRKGSFIHKSKIEQIPTGFDAKQDKD